MELKVGKYLTHQESVDEHPSDPAALSESAGPGHLTSEISSGHDLYALLQPVMAVELSQYSFRDYFRANHTYIKGPSLCQQCILR